MNQHQVRLVIIALLSVVTGTFNGACGDDPAAQARQDTASDAPGSSRAPSAAAIPAVRLSPAFPRLSFQRPVFITHAGDGTNRLFVVEQAGRILVFENRSDVSEPRVFLDIQPKVRKRHNEEGLLSLVFHPKYKENGQFFVYYSVSDPKRNRISRFNVMTNDSDSADPASEQVILEVEQRHGNHNGSTLLFGPDGYLYASLGDGGWANDPDLNGQNLSSLLAKVIRIDVDHADSGRAYAIPKDNPFIGRGNALPEIWAYGLRNIWRMSFDRQTGDLWAGDVGQDQWEEIDLVVKAGNYGWNLREGKHDFSIGVQKLGRDFVPPDPLIDPIIDYHHRDGLSVTGGYVYRGRRNTRLHGVYVYADYVTRKVWGLRYEGGHVTGTREMLSGAESAFITSFGEDAEGELYACAFDQLDKPRGSGKIYRVIEN